MTGPMLSPLAFALHALLRERGPLDSDAARDYLGIASTRRFSRAITELRAHKLLHKPRGNGAGRLALHG